MREERTPEQDPVGPPKCQHGFEYGYCVRCVREEADTNARIRARATEPSYYELKEPWRCW